MAHPSQVNLFFMVIIGKSGWDLRNGGLLSITFNLLSICDSMALHASNATQLTSVPDPIYPSLFRLNEVLNKILFIDFAWGWNHSLNHTILYSLSACAFDYPHVKANDVIKFITSNLNTCSFCCRPRVVFCIFFERECFVLFLDDS